MGFGSALSYVQTQWDVGGPNIVEICIGLGGSQGAVLDWALLVVRQNNDLAMD